ncbi:DUF350 domain-containing protein [Lacimicrobium alkaliphilum]|uniref:ATP synthase F0 subunit A n=1 Tax=Lacimicrobium alkaliphilum TaxID=1526571 RepID=A0ABQ1R834_9ALTE|nr:DUF350 domain-containing protein [Lacimicrobium alkaliphilum]GGD57979.1 ATP synthase F0 subunit A [Lacimicrobium alkaliphilum]
MESEILTLSYNPEMLAYFSADILIALVLLIAMRWVYTLWTRVDSTNELSGKDNFAFGVSVASSLLALSIVVWSAAEQASADDYLTQSLQMLVFGIGGIILIKIGRWAHDKVILNRFNKREQILQGNVSIGLVDGANTIATAIIIRSVMLWTEGFTLYSGIAILSGFFVAQTVMLVTTRLMERRFAQDNQNDSMQDVLVRGQVALAIQHGGHLLGVAFAVSAASKILVYHPWAYISNLINWLFIALLFTLLTIILAWVAKRLVLKGINLVREVDQQHNIGVASIEMALTIGVALLLLGLVS